MGKLTIAEISEDLTFCCLDSNYIDEDMINIFTNYSINELKEIILNLSKVQKEIENYGFTKKENKEFKLDLEETKNVLTKFIRIKEINKDINLIEETDFDNSLSSSEVFQMAKQLSIKINHYKEMIKRYS